MNLTWYSNSSGRWSPYTSGGYNFSKRNFDSFEEKYNQEDYWFGNATRLLASSANSGLYDLKLNHQNYVSHTLSLLKYTNVCITYYYKATRSSVSSTLKVIFFDGTIWTTLKTYDISTAPTNFTLDSIVLNTSNLVFSDSCKIYFNASTKSTAKMWWYLDDITLNFGWDSLFNGTYYCPTNFGKYNTIYYWKVSVSDGTVQNTSGIFDYKTIIYNDDSVTINYAGCYSDWGGPYYVPPTERTSQQVLNGRFLNGYYTDHSKHHEDYMYINSTVIDYEGINKTYVRWYVDNTSRSTDYEMTRTRGNYYEYNTSGMIHTSPGHNYSYDIYVVDNDGYAYSYLWQSYHINYTSGTCLYVRRWVQLNNTQTDTINYTAFYLNNPMDGTPFAGGDEYDREFFDFFQHDQGSDGGPWDTGYMETGTPTDAVQVRSCGGFVSYWINSALCISNVTVSNIYWHFWYNETVLTSPPDDFSIFFDKSRINVSLPMFHSPSDMVSLIPLENNKSSMMYGGAPYKLYSLYTSVPTPLTVSENDVYELEITMCAFNNTGYPGQNPHVLNNRSYPSFVLFNVPANGTLNKTDWSSHGGTVGDRDGDGLSDWTELYRTYTNPFFVDTDNDGANDAQEIIDHTDPNNPISFLPPDLVIQSCSIEYAGGITVINNAGIANPLPANRTIMVTATIKNKGSTSIRTPFLTTIYAVRIFSPSLKDIPLSTAKIAFLPAGETFTMTTVYKIQPNVIMLSVFTDTTNYIQESNENNNWMVIKFR